METTISSGSQPPILTGRTATRPSTCWPSAVNIGAEHFNLLADVTFRPQDLVDQGVNSMTVTFGLNFNGQTIGTYTGETTLVTNTATIPLTRFRATRRRGSGRHQLLGEYRFHGRRD